ncbi:hypothetical protein AN639_00705 [Candidatus Epulonipiscium fishelsonii]|uniref:Uncharacterized protein n=1 Tax=Candidatus Epulonipiscium fishelsonii TaxID=77094 RepID=A0ACC8X7W0_9FIRM|nr:hypothetical protein AN396_12450 [Epulopiscium sp. SCG-B11WGA-EpuloA1]ONI41318.1 hypothetical protein AN639_00705 [Epulopiscium sp. SCG-B05WGA-EpuloA1]
MIKYFKYLCLVAYILCFANSIYASSVPNINAEAAILIDAKTGTVLYAKNANEKYYPASITKLMTALLTIENLSPTDTVTFSKEAVYSLDKESSNIGMDIGEVITVDQALHGLLLWSANDVANGLAETIGGSIENFCKMMNQRAQDIGAVNTNFVNPHGFHDVNHYTTAYDMALIMREIYNNEYFLEIMSHPTYRIPATNVSDEIIYLSQQHSLMNSIRDSQMFRSDVIGGKTGYTSQAGNTLVTASRQGNIDLITVILKGNRLNYYDDTNKLLNYGFSSFTSLNLSTPKDILTILPLYSIHSGKLYEVATCEISVKEPLNAIVSSNIKKQDLDLNMTLPKHINFGKNIGDIVGEVNYTYKGKRLASCELMISDIKFLPAPSPYVFPKDTSNVDAFTYIYPTVVCISVSLFLILMLRLRRKKYFFDDKNKLKFHKKVQKTLK